MCVISVYVLSLPRICSEFETIRKKALEVPENTDDIAQMVEYISSTKTKGIAALNVKIKVNNPMFCSTCCVLNEKKYVNVSISQEPQYSLTGSILQAYLPLGCLHF